MWRRRILYAIALLLAYLGQILDVGYLFHFIFFAVLSMPLLGLLLSLPAMLGCRAELRCSSPRVLRGEDASWSLRLSNRFRLPVARAVYRMRVSSRMTGEVHRVRAVLRGMGAEEDRHWVLSTDHCGAVDCRVERLWVCDCLGLFALPVRSPAAGRLLIGPAAEDPGPLSLPENVGMPAPVPRGKSASGEEYELRAYQPGDSMRVIHWKMSAKRDDLVTRELLEDRRPLPVLTFDHFGPLERVDRTLDCLAGHSLALLEMERPHEIRWAHPETGAVRRFAVSCQREWMACLTAALSDPAPARGRSILAQPLAVGQDQLLHQIHITGEEAGHEA